MNVAAVALSAAHKSGAVAGTDTHSHRFVITSRDGHVTACAELAPLRRGVADVRSLVVSRNARSLGLGTHGPQVALRG